MPPTTKPHASIRAATPEDFPVMASVAADAFVDDDVFGRFMYPYRREFWDDYVDTWMTGLEVAKKAGNQFVVAVEEGKVVGWGSWHEIDSRSAEEKGEAVTAPSDASSTTPSTAVAAEPAVANQVVPKVNRSESVENVAAFEASKPLTEHLWSGKYARAFNLEILCVAPACQGRGYGASLVLWGIAKAASLGIPTSVIAAYERDAFYGKYGFVERGRADVGPLEGKVKGGAVMFREVDATSEPETIVLIQ